MPASVLEADRREALRSMNVSRETEDRLGIYVERLLAWQRIMNLVAPSTLDHVWTRHIADSGQLVQLAPEALRWIDLGSGAGFPGLVVAILLANRDGARVHLVESNGRKCAFLKEVARLTSAPVDVHAERLEAVLPSLAPRAIDVVTSRALAPLPTLIAWSRSLLDCGATGLFLTGGASTDSAKVEGAEGLEIDAVASRTQPVARIMRVRSQGRPAADQ